MSDSAEIECLSESIVREYLKRKGLDATLATMDSECPRRAGCISNRSELAKSLHIQQLMKSNKNSERPLRAMLEVITQDLVLRPEPHKSVSEPSRGSHVSAEPHHKTSKHRGSHSPVAELTGGSPKHGGQRQNDLVLEDSLDDGETFVGDGKAGVMDKSPQKEVPLYTGTVLTPAGHKPSRVRGMSGPISSNLEEEDLFCFEDPSFWHYPIPEVQDKDKSRMNRARSGRSNGRTAPDTPLQLADSPPNQKVTSSILTETKPAPNSSPNEWQKPGYHSQIDSNTSLSNQLDSLHSNTSTSLHGNKSPLDNPSNNNKKKTLDEILSSDLNTRLESASNSRAQKRQQDKEKEKDIEKFNYPLVQSSISKTKVTHKKERTLEEAKDILNLLSGKKPKEKMKVDDLELGDVDDLDDGIHDLDIGGRLAVKQPSFVVDSKPMDIKTAADLKTLIFGSAQQNFNDEWKYQAFTFCDLPHLQYGIVQKKGGPCGVLASVQACMLQELLFKNGHKPTNRDLEPSRDRRSDALAAAMATILWRAGDGTKAVVTLPGMRAHFSNSSKLKTDNLIEMLMVHTLNSQADLLTFLRQNVRQFELDGSSGVVLILYSVILSRSILAVRQDMDEPSGKLMGAHGYCTQEMVNLILTGRAASNVFNDLMELDGGLVLKGVHCRSDIGLLSLFEHYKSCQVGTYLKTPKNAIWVVCSESHFSVLFCLKRELLSDWKAEKRFDMYYYDGLGRQDAEIRLTIDTTNKFYEPPGEDDLVPPLELCIRTKWEDAEVDWNGTDPLL